MFDFKRYQLALKTLEAFKKNSSLADIELLLTKDEAERLQQEPQFKDLVLGLELTQNTNSSNLKKYTVFKRL